MTNLHVRRVARVSLVVALGTVASRLTGFISKAILLGALGLGVVNDSYTLANTLPNIVFELLVGGVLTSVVIPLLARARKDIDGGELYTKQLVTAVLFALLIATSVAILTAPLLTRLYLSRDSTVDIKLADRLAYLLLPQIIFYGLSALFGALLNLRGRFVTIHVLTV